MTTDVSSFDGDDHYGGSVTQVYRDPDAPDWRCLDSEAFVAITYTCTASAGRRTQGVKADASPCAPRTSPATTRPSTFVAFRYCCARRPHTPRHRNGTTPSGGPQR